MKNKQSLLKSIRVLFSLVVISGLVLVFSDVRAKLPSFISTFFTYFQFWPSLQKFVTIPGILAAGFLFVILLTLFVGRVYCSTLCPLGIMQDIFLFFQKRIFKKFKLRYKKPLQYIRYGILALLILSFSFSSIFLFNLLDPFANFGRIASVLYQPVMIEANNLLSKVLMSIGIYSLQPYPVKEFYLLPFIFTILLLSTIVLMIFYRGRLYCNTICPVGTFLGLLSRISLFKLKIEKSRCTQCGKCQSVCKVSCINIKELSIDESRCISCYNCIQICENSSIGYSKTVHQNDLHNSKQDHSKRDFLKSGFFYTASLPLLLNLQKFTTENKSKNESDQSGFYSRGPISPPGSISIDHMKSDCIGCQLCISTCPTKVLQPAFLDYGLTGMMIPRMNYDTGYCNYECTKCGEVCPSGAILPLTKEKKKVTQIGTVVFEQHHCVVFRFEKSCGSCSEHCPTQAVHMVPYKGFLTIPSTNAAICIGCGACEHVCPVSSPHAAIYVMPDPIHGTAQLPSKEIKVKSGSGADFPF